MDIHVEVIAVLANRVEAELGVAFVAACCSALRKPPVSPALLILGDMSVQENIKPLRSLTEPFRSRRTTAPSAPSSPSRTSGTSSTSARTSWSTATRSSWDAKTAAMKVLGG